MDQIGQWLSLPFWTGVGGIVQAIAAIFAIFTVIQAQKALAQSDQSRRESVMPDWDYRGYDTSGNFDRDRQQTRNIYGARFINSGFGPARYVSFDFQLSSGTTPIISNRGGLHQTVYLPDEVFVAQFIVFGGEGFRGRFTLSAISRLGDRVKAVFEAEVSPNPDQPTELLLKMVPIK